jgi:hypothetical protein
VEVTTDSVAETALAATTASAVEVASAAAAGSAADRDTGAAATGLRDLRGIMVRLGPWLKEK